MSVTAVNQTSTARRRQAMALARWTPYRDLMAVRDEMNRVFNEAFGRGSNDETAWFSGAWSPPVDIYETNDALVMKAELPGFSKDDIHVELLNNRLTLHGERKHEAEVKEEQYHRRERP